MPRIDVSELREYASGLRAKGEELRERTAQICQLFLGLADTDGWNDSRYLAFQLKFEEKTLRAGEFADRIERYAEWIQRLANEVEERWGETMNVS